MHIVSYRGPGMAGGVSAALARAWECNLGTGGLWWHLTGNEFQVTSGAGCKPSTIAQLSAEVVQGHYRFCNDFLWPLMHDLPQYARYVPEDYAYYKTFNETVGWCLARANSDDLPNEYFLQDYQLALAPEFMKNAGYRSMIFWHIPWPKNVDERFKLPIIDIVRGMLNTEAIGFHTDEYAKNFLSFVQQNLREYGCSEESMAIWSSDHIAHVEQTLWAAPNRARAARTANRTSKHITRMVVAPLGIDFDHWSTMALRQQNTLWHPALMRTPFVLSVDRADYTKGVTDRIRAIDYFFERHPEWEGRVVFAQICGRTRSGLPAFEKYWEECQSIYARLKDHCATDSWQPLLWIESSFAPADLAHAYRTASAMFISAVRDGLNLTAKEYVACQGNRPGVLALSSGTGSWQELGSHCVTVSPEEPEQMAEAIHQALAMDGHERTWRMALLKDAVRSNTLNRWWYQFASLMDKRPSVLANLRETS